MLTTRGNIHRSKLPKPGAIGRLAVLRQQRSKDRWIVESYPLCDNVQPYSIGIHTVIVRSLRNGERRRISGIWFDEE